MEVTRFDLTPLPRKSCWQRFTAFARLLRHGVPQREAVHDSYNVLRQEYILDAARHHFSKRADDPAPLYGMNLLDVGCGATPINSFMVLSGADVTSVDSDERILVEAQAQAARVGTDMRFVHGSLETLVPEEQQYDVILCLDLLEYVADTERFCWSLHKLLKPGGLLVVSAINRSLTSWLVHVLLSERVFHRTPRGSRRWRGFYRPAQLRTLMQQHSFNVSTVQGLQFDPETQRWHTSHQPETRYLSTATKI